ncbi:MAG: DUF721 domain-containing protein [bacterium]|nr:DUF721 domain-containing protein [Candidatus Aquidulcis frankliniae]
MSTKRTRKGRPEGLAGLLPEAARALGFEEELRFARTMGAFGDLLREVVPHLAAVSHLVAIERGRLIVEAQNPAAAQELHLRGAELARAFSEWPGGERSIGLTVRISAPSGERD